MSDDEFPHSIEMARRRTKATERQESGPLFLPEWGKEDGKYSWLVLSPAIYENILTAVQWYPDRSPGVRTNRIYTMPGEPKRIIFRLRGIQPKELSQIVQNQTVIIGEYWPNDPKENYRGINLVQADPHRWNQDLVPNSDKVFSLTIKAELLWLEIVYNLSPPIKF